MIIYNFIHLILFICLVIISTNHMRLFDPASWDEVQSLCDLRYKANQLFLTATLNFHTQLILHYIKIYFTETPGMGGEGGVGHPLM